MTQKTETSQANDNRQPVAGTERWLEHDGARLFALDTGRGQPIVFLHGGLADHRAALFRLPLHATHRLVTPDLRGSGRSRHAGPLSWDRLADDIAAWLEHLGIEQAIVGGTSMGSAVALSFALRHPARLRGLILMSPLYPGADRPLAPAARDAMRLMNEHGQRALESGIEALRPLFEPLPARVRQVALEMLQGFDAASVAATTAFLATDAQPLRSARELESLEVPVLVLPGLDAQHPAEVAELYVKHLRRPVVLEQTAPDLLARVEQFAHAAFDQ